LLLVCIRGLVWGRRAKLHSKFKIPNSKSGIYCLGCRASGLGFFLKNTRVRARLHARIFTSDNKKIVPLIHMNMFEKFNSFFCLTRFNCLYILYNRQSHHQSHFQSRDLYQCLYRCHYDHTSSAIIFIQASIQVQYRFSMCRPSRIYCGLPTGRDKLWWTFYEASGFLGARCTISIVLPRVRLSEPYMM